MNKRQMLIGTGQIYNRIAHTESKTNREVAKVNLDVARVTASDSRTMKSIAFLELIFLPAIFVGVSGPPFSLLLLLLASH